MILFFTDYLTFLIGLQWTNLSIKISIHNIRNIVTERVWLQQLKKIGPFLSLLLGYWCQNLSVSAYWIFYQGRGFNSYINTSFLVSNILFYLHFSISPSTASQSSINTSCTSDYIAVSFDELYPTPIYFIS